jgi:hypothetical protein
MDSYRGAAVGHKSTAYFSRGRNVCSYTVPGNKWTKLPECKYEYFALAVVNDALTAVGGEDRQGTATNALLSLPGSSWEEVLPPMPTKRVYPAAATTPTHLVVAGGLASSTWIEKVEVLHTDTLQWSTTSSLPDIAVYPQMTTCGECLYLSDANNYVFSCSVEDLLKSTTSNDGGSVLTRLASLLKSSTSVWTSIASIPTPCGSGIATLKGRVLAIGGAYDIFGEKTTGVIHCYDVATNSWSVIGKMPTPRSYVLTAVLPSNALVVTGGYLSAGKLCSVMELCKYYASRALTLSSSQSCSPASS